MANGNAIFLAGVAVGLIGAFVIMAWASWLGQLDAGRLKRLTRQLETMLEAYQRNQVDLVDARQELAAMEEEMAVYVAMVHAQQMRGGEQWSSN